MTSRWPSRLDVGRFTTLNRRALLRGLGASALLTASEALGTRHVWGSPVFAAYPFSLGVASGEPAADGFVLWTKIAPRPLERGGGMPNQAVEVDWEVAQDERMRRVVQKGTATALPELGHSVHVETSGLEPARDYYYRFTIGGERSRTGRARTLSLPGAPLAETRFGLVGCQKYEDGFFTAYREVAAERFDFVFHYGDYIYEQRAVRPGERPFPVVRVLPGEPDECFTLDDYRRRYAIYKLDLELQNAHASTPFVMSYDDHEVVNNWAGNDSRPGVPPEVFMLRREAAFQAWYENVPVRRALLPHGPEVLAYRRVAIGDLVTVNVLDTRLYRTGKACGGGVKIVCAEALAPSRTMLGEAQERWLYDGFRAPTGRWNVLAQQVMMMRNERGSDPDVSATDMDKWDGAVAARDRLFAAVEEAKLPNLVVLSGDIHNNWAGELKRNFLDMSSPTLGVELVGTSISSGGDGYDTNPRYEALLAREPFVKFFNNQRGYVRNVVTPQRWQADFQVVDRVTTPDGHVATRKSLVVESGKSALGQA